MCRGDRHALKKHFNLTLTLPQHPNPNPRGTSLTVDADNSLQFEETDKLSEELFTRACTHMNLSTTAVVCVTLRSRDCTRALGGGRNERGTGKLS